MNSDTSPPDEARTSARRGPLVGMSVTVRHADPEPGYFTGRHRQWIGKTGRVHAIVPQASRDNPLVKVGFDEGKQIVFFRLIDLELQSDVAPEHPRKHGRRGSHLPSRD